MAKRPIIFPSFRQPPETTFSTGSLRTIAALDDLESTAFFLSGRLEVREVLAAALAKQGRDVDSLAVLSKPPGEPTFDMVQSAAEFLQERPYKRIVGVGGGSVLDWCRLAWAASLGELSLDSPLRLSSPPPSEQPEFWLIPTTCATGAEAASVAVYTHKGEKRPVICDAFLASQVILDARFLRSLDDATLSRSLADAISHAIEAFVSIVPNYLAKEAALSALGMIFEFHDSSDVSYRHERLLEAAYLAGLAASHCSVGVIHGFAHTVARYAISHGLGNAIGLIPGLRTNGDVPAIGRLLERLGIDSVDDLVRKIEPIIQPAIEGGGYEQLTTQLDDANTRADIRDTILGDVCLRSNPCPLEKDDIERMLSLVDQGLKSGSKGK